MRQRLASPTPKPAQGSVQGTAGPRLLPAGSLPAKPLDGLSPLLELFLPLPHFAPRGAEATQNMSLWNIKVVVKKNYPTSLDIGAVASPGGRWLTRGPRGLLGAGHTPFLSWVLVPW